ncbi:MAG: transglutaminase-like domain-containing protein, partial [Bacteroidota bacterium]|nr:transglutaminase-like domain-containing protein [Bacteroidota bacterium]
MSKKIEHSELMALIRMLDEPDERLYSAIYDRVVACGSDIIPLLEKEWETLSGDLEQERILDIIHKLQLEQRYQELAIWGSIGQTDLLEGYMIVTRFLYPDIDRGLIDEKIADIRKDIGNELNSGLTSLQKIATINHILYDIYHFRGNTKKEHYIQSQFLNHLLETKKGAPISIGILYIILAQSLGMPVYGVKLPDRFVLAYTNAETHSDKAFNSEVEFYYNPFHKGIIFTRNEIKEYIEKLNLELKEEYFRPVNNKSIINRLIADLIIGYKYNSNNQKIE